MYWCKGNCVAAKKRKREKPNVLPEMPNKCDEDDDDDGGMPIPFIVPKFGASAHVYNSMNHVYFNDDITEDSAFALNKELQAVKTRLALFANAHGMPASSVPIYLHLTTNGGSIHAAFSVVDCIQTLGVPVHTVVDGFVASAGTLISICSSKRYIMPNAYMLIHELRSGVWGKMSSIEEEVMNLKKIMDHINKFYQDHTKLSKKALEKLLTKDVIWNAGECVSKGIVDEIYKGINA